MAITVFHYPNCSTCRKALKWLDQRGLAHERIDIVSQPPSKAQLAAALDAGVPLRSLFNTSGQSYRDGNFKEKLPSMTQEQALKSLSADGKLIKRPFVIADGSYLVGFDEAAWRSTLA